MRGRQARKRVLLVLKVKQGLELLVTQFFFSFFFSNFEVIQNGRKANVVTVYDRNRSSTPCLQIMLAQ